MEKYSNDKFVKDNGVGIPLYVQIREIIEAGITSGEIAPDENGCLPTQQFFADKYNVAVLTVKRAIQGLEHKGLVESIRGKGLILREQKDKVFSGGNSVFSRPTIGFYFLHEAVDRMSRVAEFIQRACAKRDHDLKVISFDRDFYSATDLLYDVKSRNLVGAIMVTIDSDSCLDKLRQLEYTQFPVVRIGNSFFGSKLKSTMVVGNESQKCRDAMNYLWNLGHRRIGLITSEIGAAIELEYWKHYAGNGGGEHHWLINLPFRGPSKAWHESNLEWMCEKYLADNPDVTAIITAHPSVCREMLSKAQSIGREIPGDLSLISLTDDRTGVVDANPPITCMQLPEKTLGENACDALFETMNHGFSGIPQSIDLAFELVERSSVTTVRR